ncbi:hypothetical protein QBC47DRAFT_437137 [Echria macrotheca]|uniref:Uncharacterized protein n=1 Tax=Echria macrotheca TaxID=438768 RepID=A0AAJ0BJN3_9PEZI|nr:hypothetical protein QBC47DRAFT_437137 [Echria macrotheca]
MDGEERQITSGGTSRTGYWAEREVRPIEEATTRAINIKRWKRRRRRQSAKSKNGGRGSSQDGTDVDQLPISADATSPKTPLQLLGPTSIGPLPPISPYLTEEAHVLSLQRPPVTPEEPKDSPGWPSPRPRESSLPEGLELPSPETVSPSIPSTETHSFFSWTKGLSNARLKNREARNAI